jgi:hypothetical protein
MDADETRHGIRDATRRWVVPVVLVVSGVVAGGTIAGGIASAASAANGSSGSPSAAPQGHPGVVPADMKHGPGEALLTGTTADKVTAAAEAAVPNATVIRVETDSEGSPYEAHMQKADGSFVTVKVDASFKVTSTEDGFGAMPQAPSNTGNA